MTTPIPAGIATRAGLTGATTTLALAVAALATDHTPAAYASLATSAAALLTVLAGRYAQATALAIRPTSSPTIDGTRPAPLEATRPASPAPELVEPDVWGDTTHDPTDPSLNADPKDIAGAHDHPQAP